MKALWFRCTLSGVVGKFMNRDYSLQTALVTRLIAQHAVGTLTPWGLAPETSVRDTCPKNRNALQNCTDGGSAWFRIVACCRCFCSKSIMLRHATWTHTLDSHSGYPGLELVLSQPANDSVLFWTRNCWNWNWIQMCWTLLQSANFTDEPHGNEMTFDYLDMIESLQHSLDIPTIKKLCEYFNMTSSLGKIKASDKPQHHFLLECRRKCIITRKDTTKLLEAFRETGLSNLQRIIEDYNQISNCPDVRVTVNNDNPTSAFSSFKTFMLLKKRAIKSVFTRDKGIHFVDCQEGSLVICLKVSSVEELDKLKEYIESGVLLRRLMSRYESEISDTERKDFQSESSSIKLSYDTEEFENAKQQLTTNSK
ncbi:hypothetical protein BSL78_09517 [Apostichopus japonicus]|uniref:Uncharacterized protein n=1 Tax=Stichopus japonicus TaxID=307972 RepID=A0A2G8L015_STIJA|nr:hypothetical protein BSL78_09517 [Apostichopus japonicus]